MGNSKSNNKHLIIILAVLITIITGLSIGIIILKNNSADTANNAENEAIEDEDPIARDFRLANEAEERYNSFSNTIQSMLANNPVDENAIKTLYIDAIEEELSLNNEEWVYEYLMHASGVLGKKAHLYRTAIDIFNSVDITNLFFDPDLYRLSSEAIIIAEALNDTDLLNHYKEIQKSAEEEYLREAEVTQRNIDNPVLPREISE